MVCVFAIFFDFYELGLCNNERLSIFVRVLSINNMMSFFSYKRTINMNGIEGLHDFILHNFFSEIIMKY